jgi:hypothetical protein
MEAALGFLAPVTTMTGDVTADGFVTPTDAQAIFECYLLGSCAGDLDALAAEICPPAGITPGDAQGAFMIFLGLAPCG